MSANIKHDREVYINHKKPCEFHMDVKVAESGKRRIKGFASTRFKDRAGDVVSPEAIEASMQLYQKNPVVLLNHDQSKPIGKMIDYEITKDGLYVVDEIGKGFADADEAWSKIEQGILRALSIGFIPLETQRVGDDYVISELELVEHSVVSIPSNRESLFSVEKAFKSGSDLISVDRPDTYRIAVKEIERHLKVVESLYPYESEAKKIEFDALKKRIDSLYHSDEEEKLLSEVVKMQEELLKIEGES